jgi:hypothetical protein
MLKSYEVTEHSAIHTALMLLDYYVYVLRLIIMCMMQLHAYHPFCFVLLASYWFYLP